MPPAYDPFDLEVREDPYPCYAELRRDAPVYRVPGSGFFAVSRYDDVHFVLTHPELFSSRANRRMTHGTLERSDAAGTGVADETVLRGLFEAAEIFASRSLLAIDGDEHARMRTIVQRGFTPRRIAALEPLIRRLANRAADRMLACGDFDLVAELAEPLPVAVIAGLLGVDADRHADFKRWSRALSSGISGSGADTQPDALAAVFQEFTDYFMRVADARRRTPRDDLVSELVAAAQGEVLSPLEVIMFSVLLLGAGIETTSALIGNAVTALLEHPAELARLRADPSLVPSAVEETLRYDSPSQFLYREAERDVALAGTTIPKGAVVLPLFASANRDARRFADPDRFDVTRDARGHLSFSFGSHFCLGAALARLEGRVALEVLLARLPHLSRRAGRIERVDSFLIRGVRSLPLSCKPR